MLKVDYNPDVLSCIANLSSDEVFTPPRLANDMLDLLPSDIWKDKNTRFLDPFSKSGIFLREITKRLLEGLKDEISDNQERLNHILKNQVYGISITELTSFLSRRTLYCSKIANGNYSICSDFDTKDGNIYFKHIEHTWQDGSCIYCNASQEVYEREQSYESYAYNFLHVKDIKEIYNMKFDVIIGNPPYQLSDGGFGKSAKPIYHKFVEQSKKLNPTYLSMIIPSRWFAGGKGLDRFREQMLNDNRTKKIVDFWDSTECFPGVDLAGGVCYFLWDKNYKGDCEITNIHKSNRSISTRPLNEFNTLVRFGTAVSVIKKVLSKNYKMMSSQVSSRKPFGLGTNIRPMSKGDLKLIWNGGEGDYSSSDISTGLELIPKWKVITSKVSYDHGGQPDKEGKRRVLSKVMVIPPYAICTETYLVAGIYDNENESNNLQSYLKTKFVRFLISQLSFSQDITKDRFRFVPILDQYIEWSDKKLFELFELNEEEIDFINSSVRIMD